MAPPSGISIGRVGLGHMGDLFAENLLADGYGITAYDRDADRVQALDGKGAQAAQKAWMVGPAPTMTIRAG